MTALLTHPLIAALASALLHSLWVFAVLISLSYGITQLLSTAKQRYTVHLTTLLALPASFLLVLWLSWREQIDGWTDASALQAEIGTDAVLRLTTNLSKLGITIEPGWMSYTAVAYLVGLAISLNVCIYRYFQTRSLRKEGYLPPPELRTLFETLRQEITPTRDVTWKISQRVGSALAVGILRPVILFPVGLVNALTPEEVEAILRHELTHLRHNDMLWNAVQELILSLFFYHPLVYLLARWLDREREYACDDAASQRTDRAIYARALVRTAKFSLHPLTTFTMAATNNRHFSDRIQRLFAPKATPTAHLRSYLLMPLAILPLCLLLAFAPGNTAQSRWGAAGDETTATALAPEANEHTVRGKITACDTGKPLIGVTIMIEGTSTGSITDFDGNYEIRVPTGRVVLTTAYVGYEPMRVIADFAQNETVNIVMCQGEDGKAAFFKRGAAEESLTISANGGDVVKITKPEGADSAAGKLSDNILLLVDGKPMDRDKIEDISPDTIEKVEVIKDPAKIKALGHGTGFEGVILVTTKK